MDVSQQCGLCGVTAGSVIRTKLRGGIERKVLRCGSCGLVFLEPRDDDLKEYYREAYRKVHTPSPGQETTPEEIFKTYLPMQRLRIAKLTPFLKKDARLLDIGCSAGHFLKAVAPLVGECMGIEYNAKDAEFVRGMGYRVWSSPIEQTDIPKESLDIITVFQTFEHIPDPVRFLETVGMYLKPDGYLVMEVPNINDPLLTVFGSEPYADFYFREPHIFYYSPETLRRMVERCGYAGDISTIQRYHVLNHFWWLYAGRPQPSASVAMGDPELPIPDSVDGKIRQRFNKWIREADREYKEMLGELELGESIFFIGQKNAVL